MKKTLIIICYGILVAGTLYLFRSSKTTEVSLPVKTEIMYQKKEVKLGNSTFILEIADTETLQERGLSYRSELASNTGMLFVFNTPNMYYFWMKDMNFPIDIIWLDENKKVVHIERALSPSTYPGSFGPQTPTQYVIEIGAGAAAQVGLKTGDVVNF